MADLAEQLEPPVPEAEIAEAAEQATGESQETPEVKQEVKQEPEKEKVVPHGAFHEERERRKAAQREVEEVKRQSAAQMAVLNDRLQQIYAATQQNQQPQYRDPNADPDPLAALGHNQQLTLQQMAHLQNRLASEDARRQQDEQRNQLIGWGRSKAAEFAAEKPDFSEAYQHMGRHRAGVYHAMGMPPDQIKDAIEKDELWVMATAAQTGKNPAEVIYQMAVNTGYKPGVSSAQQKIETLQKGAEASKGLGNGAAATGKPTPEQIAAMSDEQFDKFKRELASQGKRISDVM